MDGATLALAAAPSCEFPLESSAGLERQTARALALAGQVWGVEPQGYLTGWTISYCRGWFLCAGGGQAAWTYGCAYLEREAILAAPGPTQCIAGVLIHELGHLVLGGDGAHHDPRFQLATDLAAVPCE